MPSQKPQTLTGHSNQALVQIDVAGGALSYFPRRCGDTVIFNCYDPKWPPGALPREVRWVVTGLKPGQFVRIEPKRKAGGAMFRSSSVFEIRPPFNSVTSGFPLKRAGAGRCLVWAYNVVLSEKTNVRRKTKAPLDPEVIIKDHP
jgi:hypothetical protein